MRLDDEQDLKTTRPVDLMEKPMEDMHSSAKVWDEVARARSCKTLEGNATGCPELEVFND